jgi:hypothetical protein
MIFLGHAIGKQPSVPFGHSNICVVRVYALCSFYGPSNTCNRRLRAFDNPDVLNHCFLFVSLVQLLDWLLGANHSLQDFFSIFVLLPPFRSSTN